MTVEIQSTAIDLPLTKDYTCTTVHRVCPEPFSCKQFVPEKLLVHSIDSPLHVTNGVALYLSPFAQCVVNRALIGDCYRACTVAVPAASISLH